MSINKILFFLSLIYLNLADNEDTAPDFVSELTCGKSRPKKEKDCTKYGTGSGMLCCWVAPNNITKYGSCYLLPETIADAKKLNDKKTFTLGEQLYWSCGNKSTYLNINIIILFLIAFLFLKI